MHLFASKTLLGLDIQPFTIRFVLLKKTKYGHLIKKIALYDLPPNILMEDKKIRSWEALTHILKESVTLLHLQNHKVNILLPESLVKMGSLIVTDHLPESVIQEQIKFYLFKEFGIEESMAIDFVCHNHTQQGREVLFVATNLDYLNKLVMAVNKAGLKVKIVELDQHALARSRAFPMTITELKADKRVDHFFLKDNAEAFAFAFGAALHEGPQC